MWLTWDWSDDERIGDPMGRTQKDAIADLAAELEEVMKCSNEASLSEIGSMLPLLDLARSASDDPDISSLLDAGIAEIDDEGQQRALSYLFLGSSTTRWTPLAERGGRAAGELNITYDGFRRRNSDGVRPVDRLLSKLAGEIANRSDLLALLEDTGLVSKVVLSADQAESAMVFMSYSQADDKHLSGHFSKVRDLISSEFRFQTGRSLRIFQDTRGIGLGENWQDRLNIELDTTDLLLVFLTPSYLASEACRSELSRFLVNEERLGRNDLVLVIYFAEIGDSAHNDELARTLLERQYEDWRETRFLDPDSPDFGRRVATLVEKISKAVKRTVDLPRPSVAEREPLGINETVLGAQIGIAGYVRSLQAVSDEVQNLATAMQEETQRAKNLNRSGPSNLLIFGRLLNKRISPIVEAMERASKKGEAHLDDVNDRIIAMAELATISDEDGIDESIFGLVEVIDDAYSATLEVSQLASDLEVQLLPLRTNATVLRPILDRLVGSVQIFSLSASKFEEWSSTLLDSTDQTSARGEVTK